MLAYDVSWNEFSLHPVVPVKLRTLGFQPYSYSFANSGVGKKLACPLFLYDRQDKNDFYIFKWLNKNQKKKNIS
jgi:hypothetical protein